MSQNKNIRTKCEKKKTKIQRLQNEFCQYLMKQYFNLIPIFEIINFFFYLFYVLLFSLFL